MCLETYEPEINNYSYRSFQQRIASFKTWNGKINPKLLATYGFYFTLNKDICKCYYCGATIFQWEYDDCPIKEHYKYAKNCDLNECLWFCKYDQNNPD